MRVMDVLTVTAAFTTVSILLVGFGLVTPAEAIAVWVVKASSSSMSIFIKIWRTLILPVVLIWHHHWDTQITVLGGTGGLQSPEHSWRRWFDWVRWESVQKVNKW